MRAQPLDKKYIKIILLILVLILSVVCVYRLYRRSFNTQKQGWDGAYFINLDRQKDRRENMKSQFRQQKLAVSWYSALDKNTIDEDFILNLKQKGIITNETQIKPDQYGTLGCFLSHTQLWKKLYEENAGETFLIFEDDCKLQQDFKKKVNKYMQNAPTDWDMIYLGYNTIKGERISRYFYKPHEVNRGNSQHHCYLVKRKSLPKMLNILYPLKHSKPSQDNILRENFNKFNAYFVNERLAIQDLQKFPISERTGRRNS